MRFVCTVPTIIYITDLIIDINYLYGSTEMPKGKISVDSVTWKYHFNIRTLLKLDFLRNYTLIFTKAFH